MNLTWLYVGVLYAIAARLARVPLRAALLFYALVLGFLWRPLTEPVTIIPADVVKLVAPWSELHAPNRGPVTKYEVSNLNLHDVTMQIVPWMVRPVLANGQSTPLSPLRLLVRPLPLGYAMNAEAAMKLLVALTLMFLLCRTRYSMTASLAAAIAYGFSTWMITWLQFPIAAAAAFLPGIVLAIEKKHFVLMTAVFAITVLSGHPETVFNVALLALVTVRFRLTWRVVQAALLAALIASPFLIPFARAVVRSQRFAETRAPRDITPPFSDKPSALLLLQPRFFGELPIERPWGPTTLESICGFAGVLALASVVAAAIYLAMRRKWRERELFYVVGFVVCLGVVLGWPLITPAFHAIAGLAPTMRMRLGLCWFASLLIAAVIDWSRNETRVPLLLGALAVSATMLWALRTTAFPSDAHRVSAILSLLPSVAVLAALIIPRIEIAIALTFVELFVTMHTWNPILPLRELYPKTPLIAALQRIDPHARIVGTGSQLYPYTGAIFGFDDVRPHDPMADASYVALLHEKAGWNSQEYYAKWNDTDTPLLDELRVKYVVTEPTRELEPPRYKLLYSGRDGRIYELTRPRL
ncbi:MAG TPA: hypothetical protein VJZ00_09050 [Thermoanaerobaculia bacterium]|nr:hypothetical protein [Thermoanaerobaculia bacterium]